MLNSHILTLRTEIAILPDDMVLTYPEKASQYPLQSLLMLKMPCTGNILYQLDYGLSVLMDTSS